MKVIGLMGGIGSGKSAVTRILAEMGAVVLDADKIGHEAYQPDTEAWKDIIAAFGEGALAPDGSIDRQKLGEVVFGDSEALARLNSIMHPRMYEMAEARIEEYRRQGVKVLVLEAPLLLEAGWTPLVDEIWVTVASEPTVIKRVKRRTGLSEEQIRSRIRAQMSNEERMKRADVVINNNDSIDELRARVVKLWEELEV